MQTASVIIAWIALVFLVAAEPEGKNVHRIDGLAHYIKANNNGKEAVLNELKHLDINGLSGLDPHPAIKDVTLEIDDLTKDEGPDRRLSSEIRFTISLETSGPSKARFFTFHDYAILRFNGLSSPGALRLLSILHGKTQGNKPVALVLDEMPAAEFERLEKVSPFLRWVFHREYLEKMGKRLSVFDDGDLVWILERSADDLSCEFITGIDGRHLHSAGFRWAFDKDVREFPVGPLSDDNTESLRKRLATRWGIEWIPPDDVPSPYSQGPPM